MNGVFDVFIMNYGTNALSTTIGQSKHPFADLCVY